jgi:membrane protein
MASQRTETPTDLPAGSWKAALKRTVKEFQADNLTDWAAALTYYAVLSIFPALLALVSVVGLLGNSAANSLRNNLNQFTPGPAHDIVRNAIDGLTASQTRAGILLVVGIAAALWSASGYIAAFMRAANAVWDVEEGRPFWVTTPIRLGITVLVGVLLTASVFATVVTGSLAHRVGDLLGVGGTAVTVWDWAKWPVILLFVAIILAVLYWASPNVRQPSFRWVTPGSLVAVGLWVLASVGFAFYVANFSSYNKTYGTLGGVVAFLVWLWISNIAVLFGAELNAEIERGRQIEAGMPPDTEPYLAPRDTRKMSKKPAPRVRS